MATEEKQFTKAGDAVVHLGETLAQNGAKGTVCCAVIVSFGPGQVPSISYAGVDALGANGVLAMGQALLGHILHKELAERTSASGDSLALAPAAGRA